MKANKKVTKVILYTICVVLVCFYMFMLYLGKNPKVGTEYRMYYLTHELSEWPGFGKLQYVDGTKEYYSYDTKSKPIINTAVRRGTGWDFYQYNGKYTTKTKDNDAYVYYVLNNDSTLDKVLKINISNISGVNNIKIYINSIFVGTIEMNNTDCEYTIPKDCIKEDGLLAIHFELQDSAFQLNSIIID